eukprot:scaffold90100_cov35-Prasinocladus_malaysianus.AAC.1
MVRWTVCDCKNGWVRGKVVGWTDKWINERMSGRMKEGIIDLMNKWMDRWMACVCDSGWIYE